ncbi:MAG: SIMPL domain-containing protein [Desulfobacterales bacterium]
MQKWMCFVFIAYLGLLPHAYGQAPATECKTPTLRVRGNAEVSAVPDRAVVQLGAVAQSANAGDAQKQVNRIVSDVLEAIKAIGDGIESITTTELTLTPVYEKDGKRPRMEDGRIIGYRAGNVVRVVIKHMKDVGSVIDAGIGAGANRLEGVFFEMKDDSELRKSALQRAVLNAREKALGIAEALSLRLVRIQHIEQEDVHMFRPGFQSRQMAATAAEGTPIEPGRIHIDASAVIQYRIEEAETRQ